MLRDIFQNILQVANGYISAMMYDNHNIMLSASNIFAHLEVASSLVNLLISKMF